MKRQEVIDAICQAVDKGRHANRNPDHFLFPTDCICADMPGWNFQYSRAFLEGMCDAIQEYAANYAETY